MTLLEFVQSLEREALASLARKSEEGLHAREFVFWRTRTDTVCEKTESGGKVTRHTVRSPRRYSPG